MTEALEDKGPALPWGWLFHSQFFIQVVYFGRPSLVNTETRKYPKINKEVVIANRSSFVFPRISLTQARSCRPKRSKTSWGHVRGDGHPSTGGRRDGGGLAGRPAGGCRPYATAATPACTSLWKSWAEASPQLPPRPGETRGSPPCLRGSSVPSCPERVAHPAPEFSRGFSCPSDPCFSSFMYEREQLCR